MLISIVRGKTQLKFKFFKDKDYNVKRRYYLYEWSCLLIFTLFLGGVAGIGAVNILNSDGDTNEVIVLALVAGLSSISYLKGIALVDTKEEDEFLALEEEKENIENSFEESFEEIDFLKTLL